MRFDAPRHWATQRIEARAISDADRPFVQALMRDVHMTAHRPDPTPDSVRKIDASVTSDLDHWSKHGVGRWTLSVEGQAIGMAGLTVRADRPGLNMSYHIGAQHWGQGLAGEIAEGLVQVADALSPTPDCIYALIRPANPASARVAERAGLVRRDTVMLGGAPTELWELPLSAA